LAAGLVEIQVLVQRVGTVGQAAVVQALQRVALAQQVKALLEEQEQHKVQVVVVAQVLLEQLEAAQ
jgi:hypothetical protein